MSALKWFWSVIGSLCLIIVTLGGVVPMFYAAVDNQEQQNLSFAIDYWSDRGYKAYADPSGTLNTQDLLPTADSTYDIGASGTEYANAYFDNVTAGQLFATVEPCTVAAANSNAIQKAQAKYVCDGTSATGGDDVEIQAAIDEIAASAWGRGTVTLAAGRFYTSNTVSMKPYVALVGSNPVIGTEIYLILNSNCDIIRYVQDVNGQASFIRLEHLRLSQTNTANQTMGCGVNMTYTAPATSVMDVTIEDVWVYAKDYGFAIQNGWGVKIEDCLAEYCGNTGFYLNAFTQGYVTNCFSAYNGNHGYDIYGSDYTCIGCNSRQNTNDGGYFRSDISSRIVNFGSRQDGRYGMNLGGFNEMAVSNSAVRGSGSHGVLIGNLYDSTLVGIISEYNTGAGIYCTSTSMNGTYLMAITSSNNGASDVYVTTNPNHYYTKTARNSGTATLLAGATSVNVTHSLASAPTRVRLTPTADTDGKDWWVSAKAATTFTITVDSASSGNLTFDWIAFIGED